MYVVVVIPAHNEEGRVGETVRSVLALQNFFLPSKEVDAQSSPLNKGELEVVVVDDGSTDGTFDAAAFAGASVLEHIVNRGQGAALQTGTEWALAQGADYIVHFDADGQFDAQDIIKALMRLQESSAEIILGSRTLHSSPSFTKGGIKGGVPLTKRYILFPVARVVNWAFTGLMLSDVHNGFRVFSRHTAKQIVIEHDRMAHGTEIIGHIRRLKLPFEEMPVSVKYDEYGQGIRGGFKILNDLLLSWLS